MFFIGEQRRPRVIAEKRRSKLVCVRGFQLIAVLATSSGRRYFS